MSLIWDCSNCVAGPVPRNDEERDWLQRLGFGAPVVKLDTITADNVNEWVFRFRLLERFWPDTGAGPMPVTAFERWIGLRTNVARVPQPEWVSEVAQHITMDILMNVQCELYGS